MEVHYHQQQGVSYYQQQQTPEIMNNSVCSSDSQTLSPPTYPNGFVDNSIIPTSSHFEYSAMVGYQQQGHFYDSTGVYPQIPPTNQSNWYPNDPSAYYMMTTKIPSYTNGVNLLEFSPNSDQSMQNLGSPDQVAQNANKHHQVAAYHASYNPTIV